MQFDRILTRNEADVITRLSDFDVLIKAERIQVDGLGAASVGKILSNLQKRGYTQRIKDGYSYSWEITKSGRDLVEFIKSGDVDVKLPSIKDPKPQVKISIDKSVPSVSPEQFVFVVSEQKLASMLSARMGLSVDELNMFKQRIKTLEVTISDMNDLITSLRTEIERLRSDRDTAFNLAEAAERKFKEIHELLNR